jgi:hypothetical protein
MKERLVHGGGRALVPGSRRGGLVAAGCIAFALVAGALALIVSRSGGDASAAASYGQLPSWLPKAKVATGRLLRATAATPRLAIEGDSVSVQLRHGNVLATTVGPTVPEDGQFPVPKTSPCSFTVTFTAAAGSVPLRTGAFTILDELGHVHHPHVTSALGGALPASVRPGQTVTLDVSDVLPTGGGRLRWAPESSRPIASWDFDVEID